MLARFGVFGVTQHALLITDPERLIAFGRILTIAFAIIAIYLDPTQPAEFRTETKVLLAAYAAAALLMLIFRFQGPVDSPVHIISHVVDAVVLGWLAFLTNELASPFFTFLPYTLMAMTIRWSLRGAIAGAILLEVVLLAIGIPDMLDGESDLNFLIMRSAYFLVVAAMLGYFSVYRESARAADAARQLADGLRGERSTRLAVRLVHACGGSDGLR